MTNEDIAPRLLSALGGRANIESNNVCLTRLRVTVHDIGAVDNCKLNDVQGVLGTIDRGDNRLEIVFGPRVIEDVYRSFVSLSGVEPTEQPIFSVQARGQDPISVRISPGKKRSFRAQAEALAQFAPDFMKPILGESQRPAPADAPSQRTAQEDADSDRTMLMHMLEEDPTSSPATQRSVLVINGPNINMLGIREPAIYGKEDFPALLALCRQSAKEAGFSRCDCYQSNHEGDLVDKIQDAYGVFDGIVINPGAYTHTSIAILDALKAVSIPTVEVHISKVSEREDFRQVSYVRAACFETITGLGIQGYRKAILDLAAHLGM